MISETERYLIEAFLWAEADDSTLYWARVSMNIEKGEHIMAKKKIEEEKKEEPKFVNEPGEIVVPDYEEAKWMEGARYEYMCKARDGILKAFNWAKTPQGVEYWKTAYTKLYIMCKHMEVYMVMRRLG